MLNGLANERQLRRRIEQLQKWRAAGVKSLAEGDLFEFESQRRENSIRRAKDSAGYYNFDKRDGGRSAGSSRRDRYLAREKEDTALARLDKLKARPRKPGQPLDLDGVPGVELLSLGEKQLCSTVRIMPKQCIFRSVITPCEFTFTIAKIWLSKIRFWLNTPNLAI